MVKNEIERNLLTACFYVPKGGVGKTTSCGHIAVSAHTDHDLDVLLIDLAGTQNDLATQFGIANEVTDPDIPVSIVFSEKWELIRDNADDVFNRMTYETNEGPDLIPADPGVSAEDNNLANVPRENRYGRLAAFIQDEVASQYDVVLLDLPGKEDNITLSGLAAAENVVAPLKPGAFELEQLTNLEAQLEMVRSEQEFDADPELALVFTSMIDGRTNLSSEFVEELEEKYPGIAGESVASSANISNGQSTGRTLFDFADDELYDTGKRAREAYRDLTTQLLDTLGDRL